MLACFADDVQFGQSGRDLHVRMKNCNDRNANASELCRHCGEAEPEGTISTDRLIGTSAFKPRLRIDPDSSTTRNDTGTRHALARAMASGTSAWERDAYF